MDFNIKEVVLGGSKTIDLNDIYIAERHPFFGIMCPKTGEKWKVDIAYKDKHAYLREMYLREMLELKMRVFIFISLGDLNEWLQIRV